MKRNRENGETDRMVDVSNFENDKEAYKKNEDMKPWLNVKNARDEKLLGKWYTVKKAYLDDASKFNDNGEIVGTVEKMHLEFEEIPHKMTLNVTNFNTMKTDFGTESDEWIGQKIKLRIQKWQSGTLGIVIIDKQELEDMGESPPSSSNEPEVQQVTEPSESDINDIVNEQVNQNSNKKDWYTEIQEYLPTKPDDYEDPEKRAASWIQGIRQDIIGTGVQESKVTSKVIRDNTAILVEDGATEDHDLGKLDEAAGREIFKLLRKVESVW